MSTTHTHQNSLPLASAAESPIPDAKPSQPPATSSITLSQQYGGRHTSSWVNILPRSWIPYIQLARLSPPVGVCLVLFPHIYGFLLGIRLLKSSSPSFFTATVPSPHSPPWMPSWMSSKFILSSSLFSSPPEVATQLIRPALLLAAGSVFLSNAGHSWNDLIDAPHDALVPRTQQRPIVRGAISRTSALLFTSSQGVLLVVVLLLLLHTPQESVQTAWPGMIANLYYPFAKRHTHFAQYVLGVCLGWGVVIGTAGVLEAANKRSSDVIWLGTGAASTASLTGVSVLWTVIYDTIYASQDREDDVKIGLKSTAVLFGQWTKAFLAANWTLLAGLLVYTGFDLGFGKLYYGFTVGGCLPSLGMMIIKVDLKDSANCWWWFRYGFWLAGGSIAAGLLTECIF